MVMIGRFKLVYVFAPKYCSRLFKVLNRESHSKHYLLCHHRGTTGKDQV